jgi:beta-lactamase regulating signal transducer with metallopeptidase domain
MRAWLEVASVAGLVTLAGLTVLMTGDADCRWGVPAGTCPEGPLGEIEELVGTFGAMVAAVGAFLAVSLLVEVRRHVGTARAVRRTARTAELAGHEVSLVDGLSAPFVAGLVRSRIYCPADLPSRLSAEELRAVILHEHHHQLGTAPARLTLLAAMSPLLDLVPGGQAWLERRRGVIETAADDHAIARGVQRSVLARALVKLSTTDPNPALAGYASASEVRLRHLLGDEDEPPRGTSRLALFATSLLVIAPCVVRGLTI